MQQEHELNIPAINREVLTGLLRYTQVCFPVTDLPVGDPAWERLWYHITHDPQLGDDIPGGVPVELVLRDAVVVDPDTRRVHLDLASPYGRMLLDHDFSEDMHDFFRLPGIPGIHRVQLDGLTEKGGRGR